MKIRTDFVTNSSSSSFIAYTIKATKKNRKDAMEEYGFDAFAFLEELIEKYEIDHILMQYEFYKSNNKIYVCCESQLYEEYRYPDDEDYLEYEEFMGDYWANFGEAVMAVIEGWRLDDFIGYKEGMLKPKRLTDDEVKKLEQLWYFGDYYGSSKWFIDYTD